MRYVIHHDMPKTLSGLVNRTAFVLEIHTLLGTIKKPDVLDEMVTQRTALCVCDIF